MVLFSKISPFLFEEICANEVFEVFVIIVSTRELFGN